MRKERKNVVSLEWLDDSIAAGAQKPLSDEYLIERPTPLDRLALGDDVKERAASPVISEASTIASVPEFPEPEGNEIAKEAVPTVSTVYPTSSAAIWDSKRANPPPWQNQRYAWVFVSSPRLSY